MLQSENCQQHGSSPCNDPKLYWPEEAVIRYHQQLKFGVKRQKDTNHPLSRQFSAGQYIRPFTSYVAWTADTWQEHRRRPWRRTSGAQHRGPPTAQRRARCSPPGPLLGTGKSFFACVLAPGEAPQLEAPPGPSRPSPARPGRGGSTTRRSWEGAAHFSIFCAAAFRFDIFQSVFRPVNVNFKAAFYSSVVFVVAKPSG